jgi:hypothetical protein
MKNQIYAALLLLNAAAFVFFGLKWFFSTQAMAGELGIQLTSADAITDAQAIYGGLELGVGAVLAVCALHRPLQRAGLLTAALTLSGLALTRSAGILLATQAVTQATWKLLTTDILGAVLNSTAAIVAWRAGKKPVVTAS